MIRFEVDPTLVADAIREGRKLWIEVDVERRHHRAVLGQPSPHKRHADAVAKAPQP